jgi:hypothetical protein
MNVIFTILIALPLGYFISRRSTAVITFVLANSFLFTFQTAFLVMKWVDGDEHAFGDRGREWSTEQSMQFYSYIVLNALIIAVGVGLVILGHRIRARRTARRDVVAVS